MAVPRRLLGALLIAAGVCFLAPASTTACPFCIDERGPTLVGDFAQASMVLYGQFTNYRPNVGNQFAGGETDFAIEKVLKPHDYLKTLRNPKILTINRGVSPTKSKFIIFCDVYKDEVDPYRAIEVTADSDLIDYLTKAVVLKDRPIGERLRFCFDYLNSSDLDVALDAYREFAKADYKDYREIARKLPADRIAAWLEDEKTPPYRYGLYASLLGHCGDPVKHGKLLRTLVDDPERRRSSGIDGLLASYVMLQPKEGWAYLKDVMKNGEEDFLFRYSALRTARFLYHERNDLVSKADVVQGVALILDRPDMADFAIEDLRKWQRWEMTDRVLDLLAKETHNLPVIKRAALRFALRCPQPRAKAFVEEQRRLDPEWVNDADELLRLDETPITPPPAEKKK